MKDAISDLEVNRGIRKVFVQHRIDLGWLSIGSARGSVHIRGKLQRLPGAEQELTSKSVDMILGELRRSGGVKRIDAELVNWYQEGITGVWKERGASAGSADAPAATPATASDVFEVT